MLPLPDQAPSMLVGPPTDYRAILYLVYLICAPCYRFNAQGLVVEALYAEFDGVR